MAEASFVQLALKAEKLCKGKVAIDFNLKKQLCLNKHNFN